MNDVLTTIQGIVGIASVIIALIYMILMRRYVENLAYEWAEKAVNFYIQEKKDFVENLPMLLNKVLIPTKMSQLGKASGISRQLKGLERDLIAEGINQGTGMPIGPLVAKYVQKYPVLMQLLPMLAQKFQRNNSGGGSSEELGKI